MDTHINDNGDLVLDVRVVIAREDIQVLAAAIAAEMKAAAPRQPEEYVTREKAMELLGKTGTTLWRWDKEGYLKAVRIGGRLRYRLSDIIEIKEGGR